MPRARRRGRGHRVIRIRPNVGGVLSLLTPTPVPLSSFAGVLTMALRSMG
jgi:hypothetical protein